MTEPSEPRRKRFYLPEGDGFTPTRLSGSPWRGDAQNGLALGLLMAHTLETQADTGGGHLARFTLDIMRPAMAQLTHVNWRVARGGRRVRLLEGVLEAAGETAARATALYISPTGAPPPSMPLVSPGGPPETTTERPFVSREAGLDMKVGRRWSVDASGESCDQSVWLRVEADIVPGFGASPTATAIAAADIGGSTIRAHARDWTYPNLDIAVHFARQPEGAWVHAATRPLVLGSGVAVIDHRFSDTRGAFGRAHQTLYFTRGARSAAA